MHMYLYVWMYFWITRKFGAISDGQIVTIPTHSRCKSDSSRTGKKMVFHYVAISTPWQSVVLPTLFPSLPNKRHSSDISQTVALPTFVNCRTSDGMWSDVFNVALPTFVNCRNSDEMWSEISKVALPTFVNCRNSDEMWFDVLNIVLSTFVNCRNSDEMWSDVFKLSQFRRLQGVGIPTAGSI